MGLTSIAEKFLDMTERKMLITTLCIAVLLLSLGGATYLGVGVNLNFSYNETLNSHEYRIKVLTEWVGNLTEEQKWIIQQAIEMELNSSFYPMQKQASYIIGITGSYYTLQNGITAKLDWYSTSKTAVITAAIGNLTSGGLIYLKEVQMGTETYGDNIMIIEEYQGQYKVYSNLGKFLIPQVASDPSTAGWGSAEKGRMWFNTAEGKIKFWDGSAIQVLPSIVGGGTYKLPSTYTIYKSGSTYYAMDEDGNVDSSSTTLATVWNWVLDTGIGASGGKIYFKDGTFTVTELDSRSQNNLEIELSKGATLQLQAGQANNTNIFSLDNVENWYIHGGKLDGNYENNPFPKDAIQDAIEVYRSRNVTIQHMTLRGAGHYGVHVWGTSAIPSQNVEIFNNVVTYNAWNGIDIGQYSNNINIHHNFVSHCSDVGIAVGGTNVAGVFNIDVSFNQVYSMDLNAHTYGSGANVHYAMNQESGYNTTFAFNKAWNNEFALIFANYANNEGYSIITGNEFYDSNPTSDKYTVKLRTEQGVIIFTNNIIVADTSESYAVVVGAAAPYTNAYTLISNNIFLGLGGVYVNTGVNTNIQSNQFLGSGQGIYITSSANRTFINGNIFPNASDEVYNGGANTVFGVNVNTAGGEDNDGSTL